MLLTLAFASIVAWAPVPMPSDTPPPLPIAPALLDNLKSSADILSATRLENGSPAPRDLVLPQLANQKELVAFIVRNYPAALQGRPDIVMPWAWLLVDEQGRTRGPGIVKSSGHPAFDSLGLAAIRIARFEPATFNGRPIGVWVPLPIDVTYRALAEGAPRHGPDDPAPHFTPYTKKPELLNREQVSRALVTRYPPALRANGISGRTLTWILLNESGRVIRALVKETSGFAEMDTAALAVAQVMRFSPALKGEKPVEVWIAIPIVFRTMR